ncbi:MAG: thioredoxin family protein [Flavobacteriaceae bacterium]
MSEQQWNKRVTFGKRVVRISDPSMSVEKRHLGHLRQCAFLIALLFTQVVLGQNWESDWTNVVAKAQEDQKKILLVFSGSDWCIPCIRLERDLWLNKTFMAFATTDLLLYRADFPKRKKNRLSEELRTQNESLAQLYNPNGYFPWVVVFSPDLKIKGTFTYTKQSVARYIDNINSY